MKYFFLLLITSLGFEVLHAQQKPITAPTPLIRVYESGRYKPQLPDENLIPNNGIVEINGTLLLELNRDAIRQEMQTFAGVQPADLRLVSKYKNFLEQKTQMLRLLQEGVASANGKPNYVKLDSLSALLDGFYTNLLSDPELLSMAAKAHQEYKQKVAAQLIDRKTYTDDMYFVEYFANAAKSVLDRLESAEQVRFKLAGKLKSSNGLARPVHLGDDFDDIPEENFVVPRWVFSLSDAQKQELRAVAQVANQLDSLRIKSMKDVKNAFFSAFSSKNCFETLQKEFEALPDLMKGFSDTLARRAMAIIKPLQDQLINVQSQYLGVPNTAAGINNMEQLSGFNSQLETLNTTSVNFFKNLPNVLQQIPNDIQATPQIQHLFKLRDDCAMQAKTDINNFRRLFSAIATGYGGAGAEQDFNNKITDQVKRLSVGNLPAESFVDLTRTGRRENGDVLVLQAYVQLDNNANNAKPAQIYRQEINLQQIAMYSEVKVNLILANPTVTVPGLSKNFVFAPSYSILLRKGSRKSKFYNEFINIGIGLNISAPDFNLDGTPEFGAAFAISAIKDIISAGYGYNFGTDAPYYFIGFRVPFASAALPILNNIEK
jgi:hypothetical protein